MYAICNFLLANFTNFFQVTEEIKLEVNQDVIISFLDSADDHASD